MNYVLEEFSAHLCKLHVILEHSLPINLSQEVLNYSNNF